MNRHEPVRERSEACRSLWGLAFALFSVVVVILAVAVVVFGLIVVLYDHGESVAHAVTIAPWL